jgi:hypothetical protein
MSTPTNASLSIMKQRSIGIVIALIFAAVLSSSPVNARLATSLSGTQVTITANSSYEPVSTEIECNGEFYSFNYRQRVVINGVTAIVLTEFVYAPGTHTLYLQGTCGDLNFYGATSCACLTTEFQVLFPKIDLKTPPADVQNAAKEGISSDHNELAGTTFAGYLWIRKKE